MNRWIGRTILGIFMVAQAVGIYELGNARDDATPSPWLFSLVALALALVFGVIYVLYRYRGRTTDLSEIGRIADTAVLKMEEALEARLDLWAGRMQVRADEFVAATNEARASVMTVINERHDSVMAAIDQTKALVRASNGGDHA